MTTKLLQMAVLAAFLAVAYTQDDECNKFTECSSCINEGRGNVTLPSLKCFWCGAHTNSTRRCSTFTFNTAIPINGVECPQIKYNVGTCALNALSIIIIIAVACLIFVVLICFVCCCCCIWCAKRRQRMKVLEEERYIDEKEGIRQRSAERRAERKAKHDEIRRKYGLYHDDPQEGTYKRLD